MKGPQIKIWLQMDFEIKAHRLAQSHCLLVDVAKDGAWRRLRYLQMMLIERVQGNLACRGQATRRKRMRLHIVKPKTRFNIRMRNPTTFKKPTL